MMLILLDIRIGFILRYATRVKDYINLQYWIMVRQVGNIIRVLRYVYKKRVKFGKEVVIISIVNLIVEYLKKELFWISILYIFNTSLKRIIYKSILHIVCHTHIMIFVAFLMISNRKILCIFIEKLQDCLLLVIN